MICTKCNNPGILNSAYGKEFYYCRTCKDEIMLEAAVLTIVGSKSGTTFIGGVANLNAISYYGLIHNKPQISPLRSIINKGILVPGQPAIMHTLYSSLNCSVQAVQPFRQWTLNDWIPARDPGPNDNFCGINRSIDITKLSGIRYDGSHVPVSRISCEIYNALQLVLLDGGNPDYCLLSTKLYKTGGLGSRVVFGMNVLEDPTLADNESFLIQSDTWTQHEDPTTGNGNLVCSHPGYNARIKLPNLP